MIKKTVLLIAVLILFFIGITALTVALLHRQYYAIIPSTERTVSGTIIDCALYPEEITSWYSVTRSQIGIDPDQCEECSICYGHYYAVSGHCTDSAERGDSVILTLAQERGTGYDVVIGFTPQNKN